MRVWTRFKGHLRAFAIAVVFGLGVYAIIIALVALTRLTGVAP